MRVKSARIKKLLFMCTASLVAISISSCSENVENVATAKTPEPSVEVTETVKPSPTISEKLKEIKVAKPDKNYPYSRPLGYLKEEEQVALTFDDGPSKYTPEVLDILKEHNVKATFCMIGVNIKNYPEIARRVVEEGHQICSHSYNHSRKTNKSSTDFIAEDLKKTNNIFKKNLDGVEPVYYRAPEGVFYNNVPKALKTVRMIPLGWSVDSEDWRKPGVKKIVRNVVKTTNSGSIILMHDGGGDRTQTVKALPEIIEQLKDNGYEFTLLK